jgi:hypothetical protein
MAPSDWIALAALAVTLAVAATGLVVNAVVIDRQRKAGERTQRQREAAHVLGPVYVLLSEVNPDAWMLTAGANAADRVAAMWQRWDQTVRAPLQTIKAGSPSPDERRLADELAAAIPVALNSSSQCCIAWSTKKEPVGVEQAKADYSKASQLADQLAAVIRGEQGRRH